MEKDGQMEEIYLRGCLGIQQHESLGAHDVGLMTLAFWRVPSVKSLHKAMLCAN